MSANTKEKYDHDNTDILLDDSCDYNSTHQVRDARKCSGVSIYIFINYWILQRNSI